MSAPAGLFNTRIRDFKASNMRPVVGETVEFTGILEKQVLWWWEPLEGEPVHLVVNGGVVDTQPAGKGGWFRLVWTPEEPGKYTVWARYDGSWINNACESPKLGIEVITEEQKREEERRMFITILAISGAVIAIAGGVGAYLWYQRSRQEELRMLALAGAR